MRNLALDFVLAALTYPAIAKPTGDVAAVLAEKASGFKSLAECEQTLAGSGLYSLKNLGGERSVVRGSVFNRAAGNLSRCEMIGGEPLIVVVPRIS
jgi:hypothetical protein